MNNLLNIVLIGKLTFDEQTIAAYSFRLTKTVQWVSEILEDLAEDGRRHYLEAGAGDVPKHVSL